MGMLKFLRGLIFAVAIGTVLSLAGLSEPGRAALTAVTGSCSYRQIREGDRIAALYGPDRVRMLAAMRQLRQDGEYQLWSTAQGDFWYHGKPSELDAFVLAEEESDLYRTERIRPGSIVIDCGANYGTFTRRALLRGAAKVIAIEINPQIQEALRRTFAQEIREGRVVVYGKGVWDHDAELDLRADSVVLERQGPPQRVAVTTIDHIAAKLQLPSVDFIKMDIEGAEKNALRGAREVLARYAPTLAISGEHLADDAQRIPPLVNELKPRTYRTDYGFCLYDRAYHAAPNVMHFAK
jgi:FkbM family methyltransferase